MSVVLLGAKSAPVCSNMWCFCCLGGGGGWRSDGCFVVNATPEYTTCSCSHLTSFAILLVSVSVIKIIKRKKQQKLFNVVFMLFPLFFTQDLSREGIIDREQAQILTFITYIGCGISAIFLAVTLLTYLSFEYEFQLLTPSRITEPDL